MKPTRLTAALLAVFLLAACQKDVSDFQEPEIIPGADECLLTRIVQGTTGTPADTVYHIQYDNARRIATLVDSASEDTMTVVFGANGKVEEIDHNWGYFKLFEYTPENRLSVVGSPFSVAEFEYTADGVPVRANLYDRADILDPFGMWAYDSLFYDNAGNLVRIMEYDPTDVPVVEITITYSSLPNTFGLLSALNFENYLGMGDIFPLSVYYALDGRYMISTYRETLIATNEQFTIDVSYSTDRADKILSSRAVLKNIDGTTVSSAIASRKYFYTCQ